MVVVDRAVWLPGITISGPFSQLHVVDHHADRGEIVVGVRVEGPVLVPFDGGAKPADFRFSLPVSKRISGPHRSFSTATIFGCRTSAA